MPTARPQSSPIPRSVFLSTRLSSATVVARADDQVSCALLDEEVILNLRNGTYYGLNEVGASVWRMLDVPRSVAEIRDVLLENFEVERERCEADLCRLLRALLDHRLIEPVDAAR